MKRLLLVCCLVIVSSYAKGTVEKQPFSVNALKYLLKRKEYDRFDFYIASYLRQHPDTAVLYLLNGCRYFEEARTYRTKTVYHNTNRTGGIPRKYPEYFITPQSYELAQVKVGYDPDLVFKAFSAVRKARFLEPDRKDIYLNLCQMAVDADQPDMLKNEIKRYIKRFGNSDKIVQLVVDYSRKKDGIADRDAMMPLLRSMHAWYPDNEEILGELGKYYYHAGNRDSSYHYMVNAAVHDKHSPTIMEHAVRLAASRGAFAQACSLSLQCYEELHNLLYLEQAAIFALAYDTAYAIKLRREVAESPDYCDTLSITADLFEEYFSFSKDSLIRKFFTGNLFHLNFALFEIHYRRDRDKIGYYQYKASAFYAYGMYDSAAYYNLNLLRTLKGDDKRGIPVLFNLAAEYYATGKYSLSYHRFLDLYRFYNGWKDAAVRYGLALNCEKFGDLSSARYHYRYVARNPDPFYNTYFQLQELASAHLRKINRSQFISYR